MCINHLVVMEELVFRFILVKGVGLLKLVKGSKCCLYADSIKKVSL